MKTRKLFDLNALTYVKPIVKMTSYISVTTQIKVTRLPLDKMAIISQMVFSDAFSWMKSLYFD